MCQNTVIATGVSVCFKPAFDGALKKEGIIVYLSVLFVEIERLGNISAGGRPARSGPPHAV